MALSLLAAFDDIVRCNNILRDEGCEKEFIEFALNVEECRAQWMHAEQECQRLQLALSKTNSEVASLEGNLHHARRFLDKEKKKRKQVEEECDKLEKQLGMVRDLVFCGDSRNKLNDETKEKLAFLNNTTLRSRASGDHPQRLNTITEALNSTGSLLSDMSFSRSEDDLDVSMLRNGRRWRKHEPATDSIPTNEEHPPTKRRRSSVYKTLDASNNERLVATTVVTVAREGHMHAQSTIQALPDKSPPSSQQQRGASTTDWKTPGAAQHTHSKAYAPQPPYNPHHVPPSSTSESETEVLWPPPSGHKASVEFHTPREAAGRSPGMGGNFPSGKINSRTHSFISKTVIRPEQCGPCGKRIRFGKMAWKCRDCRSNCHAECRALVPLPCVPLASTPNQRSGTNIASCVIADFTPSEPPMVPALIVHCVNEIENRGMNEVGLYRVPGSERDVKALKERFLRQKGTPSLANIDIHVLCGTIKDFLRFLREPLLTQNLWQDFVLAAERRDDADKMAAAFQAISELPRPNRDTLAYLMLHLQKVAECKDCKMPATNLARVFGPTLLGYSSSNLDPQNLLVQTQQQAEVVEMLLSIGSDYYSTFLETNTPEMKSVARTPSSRGFFNTPIGSRTFRTKGQRFFPTPPPLRQD